MARRILNWVGFGLAALWLLADALLVLEVTFKYPCGPQSLILNLARQHGLGAQIAWFIHHGWSVSIGIALVGLLRGKIRNWFKTNHRTRFQHATDLLIVAWFVFLGTLKVVDYLSDVTLVLPHSAMDTSVSLAFIIAADIFFGTIRWARRTVKRLSRIRRRFRISARDALNLIASRSLGRFRRKKGFLRHVPGVRNQKANHRRAA